MIKRGEPVYKLNYNRVAKDCDNSNSVGVVGVSTTVVKVCAFELSEVLKHFTNLSYEHCSFPQALKKTMVKPLFKKKK